MLPLPLETPTRTDREMREILVATARMLMQEYAYRYLRWSNHPITPISFLCGETDVLTLAFPGVSTGEKRLGFHIMVYPVYDHPEDVLVDGFPVRMRRVHYRVKYSKSGTRKGPIPKVFHLIGTGLSHAIQTAEATAETWDMEAPHGTERKKSV